MNDLRVLKALGHKVNLFCLNTKKHWMDTSGFMELNHWDEFYAEEIDTNSISAIARAAWSENPFQIARFYKSRIEKSMDTIIQNANVDLLVYQGLAMTQYQRSTKCKKIYRAHNLEYRVWNLLAIHKKNYFKKQINLWLSKSLYLYEKFKLRDLSCTATLSKEEKLSLKEFYSQLEIESIPISIAKETNQNYSTEKNGLLFIGSLDWQPNRDGLDWFLKNVYPSVNHIPLTIAGKGDFTCNIENVTVISNYENTEALLASHRMILVPLLSGAGIRIKILEAMSFGMPLISTCIGAEGIETSPGSMIIEDTVEEWISQIQNVYSQPSLLTDMSQKAKLSFKNNYSKEVVMGKWQKLLSNLSA